MIEGIPTRGETNPVNQKWLPFSSENLTASGEKN
jgi:hypothetical protein